MAGVDRLASLRAELPDGCDALLVTALTNVRYLTGFTGSNGTVVIGRERSWLVTDRRYEERAAEEVAERSLELVIAPGKGHGAIAGLLDTDTTVGVEAEHLSWSTVRELQERLGSPERVRATSGLVEGLRSIKDEDELNAMRAAAAIADQSLETVVPMLTEGRSERDIALAFERAVTDLGGEGLAFDPIVASGPNGSRPHHAVSERAVSPGDLVIFDCGAKVDGYRSDMTRSFVVGAPTDQQQRMLDAVQRAQAAGVAAIRAGVQTNEIDAACRSSLADDGMDEFFVHGTGHGVGLDIHEAPSVNADSTATLAPGHVITVEPGVYLPGVGGVRWEDTVVVTETGAEPLTQYPKQPLLGV